MSDTKFEQDAMNFILYTLCEKDAGALYEDINNITAAYHAMSLFRANIQKHPILFKLFFKIY